MNVINEFILLFLLIFVNNQVPSSKVINSCGKVGYEPPTKIDDCKQEGEYCCYVVLSKDGDTNKKTFCAIAPSKIIKGDIEEDINKYTDYKLEQLECNNTKFINNFNFILYYVILFILF